MSGVQCRGYSVGGTVSGVQCRGYSVGGTVSGGTASILNIHVVRDNTAICEFL